MKIAVILAVFSEEYIYHLYRGFQRYIDEKPAQIHLYVCFGRMGLDNVTNLVQYEFLEFPDLEQYDAVILPVATIMEKPVRKVVIQKIRESGKPCVAVEERIGGFSWVGIDQYTSLRQLVVHMAEMHGAKNFCFIGGAAETYEANVREKAFRDTIRQYRLKAEPEWIFSTDYKYTEGYEVGKKLLEAYAQGKEIPDTVISSNDDMAAGVCDALYGTPLQKQVRITGFDGYLLGETYRPKLTTVVRPREEIAYECCVLLEKMLAEGKGVARRKLDYSLTYGETCGCCAPEVGDATAYLRKFFHKELRNRRIHEQMVDMEERIADNDDISSILEECLEVLQAHHCDYIKVVLREDLLSNKSISYRDCHKVWMDRYLQAGSGDVQDAEKEIRVYVPLHFQKRIMGYCCVSGIEDLLHYGKMESFFRTVGFSIENHIRKQQYYEINKKYQRLYMTDQLTGLYNRFGMEEYGGQFYQKNCSQQKDTMIIFCDIDRLKYINDTYGHKMGDWAIKTVGDVLGSMQSGACMAFRYGGDEFLMMAEAEKGTGIILAIKDKLAEISVREGQRFSLSVSIGSITAPWEDEGGLERYFIQADTAMYEEKMRYRAVGAKK